jgi:hypothetical protein
MKQLMYRCEYCRGGILYRKSPDQDLDILRRYMQAPSPVNEPNCRLGIIRDTTNSTTASLFINRPLHQPQEDLTIEYGGPYWQIFWYHLNMNQQRQMKIQHADIIFPPHWPQVIPSWYHNQKVTNQLESNYSIAARDIYDVLLSHLNHQDSEDDDTWSPRAPSQETPPLTRPTPQRRPSSHILNRRAKISLESKYHCNA